MKLRFKWQLMLFTAMATFLFTAQAARAQNDPPKKRIRSPATVRGLVGGESQDLYVIRARKGRTMTLQISWRKEENNTAGFSVSAASPADSQQLPGEESDNGKYWTGKIPKTGDYVISVTANPSAHYRLRVTVK
jgi:hypothetical protein